ncbi:MAG: pyruvate kinase, partial [Chloroflexi bacterium]|nr:pyruvate kinase [Chloroflexota bacterium]
MRRTKIVATIGPASRSLDVVERLIAAGMNVARLNMSHGTHAEHAEAIANLRVASQRHKEPLAILLDLQGPKIRTGPLRAGSVTLTSGAEIVITTRDVPGDEHEVGTTYSRLPEDVEAGKTILVDDGRIELHVLAVNETDVRCRVVNGGILGEHKGINLPGAIINAPSLTEKDREDLAFGLERGVDYVALSFVRSPEDILELKRAMGAQGASVPVVAKLEKPEALRRLSEILEVSDVVMVARGDLGIEMPPEQVPTWQKRIIAEANRCRVPVITATQMLESMIQSPVPTRAEASDVANAILDGTDAVMLSGETAIGSYPVQAVRMMSRIVVEAESAFYYRQRALVPRPPATDFSHAISAAVREIASDFAGIKAVVAFTKSGYTASLIAKERPRPPILALTPYTIVYYRLALYWGVTPILCDMAADADGMLARVEEIATNMGHVAKGDTVIITGSLPVDKQGPTNFLKLHRILEG